MSIVKKWAQPAFLLLLAADYPEEAPNQTTSAGFDPAEEAVFFFFVGVKQTVSGHCFLKETGGYCFVWRIVVG